jgi:hypothetical protein
MPANLPPQYLEAEKVFREAKTPPEKIQALEQMLAVIPHHKGTDKLIAQLRRKMAKFKEESQKKRGGGRQGDLYYIRKEGAGQVAIIGLPNVGKSTLLAQLTNATPEIADYPGTTRLPLPGMMRFENTQVQLVDTPPLMGEATEAGLFNLFRNADALLLILDLLDEPLLQVEIVAEELRQRKIHFATPNAPVIKEIGTVTKRVLLVGNKRDQPGAAKEYERLQQAYGALFPMQAISAQSGQDLDALREAVYHLLGVVRVYTKAPGKKPSLEEPVILKAGSTLADLASSIHKDFLERLKFARIWGREKYDGQKVAREYVLQEGDIVEMHV